MRDYSHGFADGKAKPRELKEKWRDPLAVAHGLRLGQPTPIAGGVRVLCPWHTDTNPSCAIQVRDGVVRARCYACGGSGDVLDLAAAVLKVSTKGAGFQQVLGYLASLPVPAVTPMQPDGRSVENNRNRRLADGEFAVLAESLIDLAPLAEQEDVVQYLASRCLLDLAKAAGWAALPPEGDHQAQLVDEIVYTVGDTAWRASGLTSDGERFAFPEHRLVIPWRDPLGYSFNLQRRSITDADDPKYVSCIGRHFTWPYGVEQFLDAPTLPLMFVEGATDVLAVRKLFDNQRLALGIPGAAGWHDEWRWLCRGRAVVLAFDADAAGDAARLHVAKSVRGVASSIVGKRPAIPCNDWAALALLHGEAS